MPSRASSETNSRADCSVSSSACRSKAARIGAVVSAFEAASPCGDALPISRGECRHRGLDVVGGDGDQTDVRRLVRAELLAGEEVAAGGAGGHLRQQCQRNDRRGHTDARLRQRERAAGRSRDRDVARTDQAQSARADVAVDGGDHRQRQLQNPAQQVGQFTGAVDGEVTGIAAHGLGQIGSGTERSAGVVQHHRAHTGLLGGVGQTLAQLVDQFGGQRVAVVRRIQRQASDTALDGVMDQ